MRSHSKLATAACVALEINVANFDIGLETESVAEQSSPNFEREIRTSAVDFSFGELLNLHRDKEIVIRPEYQRLFRWSNEQRSRLIESVIMGLPIPPIFLIENDDGVLELIDGLQRTSSVLQFLDHEAIDQPPLTLIGCDFLTDINGKKFEDLETVTKLKIKRTPIRATIINKSGDAFVKYELFKRLNTGGSLLSAQEIRNCSSRMVEGGAAFYETLQALASNPDFVTAISRLPDTMKEQKANEELVLRFFALILSRDTFKGNIEEWLDGYMEAILFQNLEFDSALQSTFFSKVFSVIAAKFGDQAFTRFNSHGEATGRLAPAYYEAVCATVAAHLEEVEKISDTELLDRLKAAFESAPFKEATGPGANTIPKLHQRIETVTQYLLGNVTA